MKPESKTANPHCEGDLPALCAGENHPSFEEWWEKDGPPNGDYRSARLAWSVRDQQKDKWIIKLAEERMEHAKTQGKMYEFRHEAARLRGELEDSDKMLEIIRVRELECITSWRKEKQDRYLKHPDYGELLHWLDDRAEKAEAELTQLRASSAPELRRRGYGRSWRRRDDATRPSRIRLWRSRRRRSLAGRN